MVRSEGRSLAQGAVVETRLCARLLGVKVLVIDGAVTLVPRESNGPVVVIPSARTDATEGPRALARSRSLGVVGGTHTSSERAALGSGLDESAKRLAANADKLRGLETS